MKQIYKSMWFLLTHSLVSISLVIAIMIFFMVFQLMVVSDQSTGLKQMMGAITISMTLSVFLGVYFGGGLHKLKQNYLWNIHRSFRHSLLNAYLILILIFNAFLLPLLWENFKHMPLVFLMPVCVAIFSSHMVLGKNVFYKIVIPAIPLLIAQLYRWNLSFNMIFSLVLLSTLILIFFMYQQRFHSGNSRITSEAQKERDANSFTTTGLNHNMVTKINSWLGDLMSQQIHRGKGNLDWAIIMPHHKLALFSVFYVGLITFAVLLISNHDKNLMEGFSILFMGSSFINILMESRLKFRQIKTIAHVYKGSNHRQLKSQILRSLDKNYLLNLVVFIVGILIMATVFFIPLNTYHLLMAIGVIVMIALAYYPVLLCFQWINITLKLVLGVSAYVAMIYFSLKWMKLSLETNELIFFVTVFVLSAIALRAVSQKIFWNCPMESLLKNR